MLYITSEKRKATMSIKWKQDTSALKKAHYMNFTKLLKEK